MPDVEYPPPPPPPPPPPQYCPSFCSSLSIPPEGNSHECSILPILTDLVWRITAANARRWLLGRQAIARRGQGHTSHSSTILFPAQRKHIIWDTRQIQLRIADGRGGSAGARSESPARGTARSTAPLRGRPRVSPAATTARSLQRRRHALICVVPCCMIRWVVSVSVTKLS